MIRYALFPGDEEIWSSTYPGTLYDVTTGFPELNEGEFVRMEAAVEHLNLQYEPPYFVIAHGPLSGHSRHPVFDNGLSGDNHGIFSDEWYVEYSCQRQRVAVDVINADTFEAAEEDCDAGARGNPFLM